ncbi:hypothetical protein ABID21_000654 [Pseudorhizobium tarimense]|uniref:Uncharacterized protein n=1 Tax=Pseudorhizobium tarimense TaxID=1079109 RepID=A0ABV2H292_9HYPH|nr:hypothetical protein [Pseudorhizobium tarimense]MCJ8517830.1 hypothetical protein [Pseudorhizobium tarimense]
MEIVNFGYFTTRVSGGVLYHTNEDGYDWYDLRLGLTTWNERGEFISSVYGAWAMVNVDGLITNVEYDPSRLVPDNKTVLGIDADWQSIQPSMVYDGTVISEPPPVSAEELRAKMPAISRRQLRLTLVRNGITLDSVVAAVDAFPEGPKREEARIEWEDGQSFERLHPTLLMIAEALDLTPAQVDAMWAEAIAA